MLRDEELEQAMRKHPPTPGEEMAAGRTLAVAAGMGLATDEQAAKGRVVLPVPSELRGRPLQTHLTAPNRARLGFEERIKVDIHEKQAVANNKEALRPIITWEMNLRFEQEIGEEIKNIADKIEGMTEAAEIINFFNQETSWAGERSTVCPRLQGLANRHESQPAIGARMAALRARHRMISNWSEIVRMVHPTVPTRDDKRKRPDVAPADAADAASNSKMQRELGGGRGRGGGNPGASGGGKGRSRGNSRGGKGSKHILHVYVTVLKLPLDTSNLPTLTASMPVAATSDGDSMQRGLGRLWLMEQTVSDAKLRKLVKQKMATALRK